MSVKKEIELLRQGLAKHAERYYVQGDPIVSDEEYDALFVRLRELEDKHPEYADQSSVTKTVGAPESTGVTVRHGTPMMSLRTEVDPTMTPIIQFAKRISKKLHMPADNLVCYLAEWKYDGLAVSLVYEDGKLVSAGLRGDGFEGGDVTANAMEIEDIPKTILNTRGHVIEIRGEVYMRKDVLAALNKERVKNDLPALTNTRNAAAGSLKPGFAQTTKERKLSFVAYSIASYYPRNYAYGMSLTTEDHTLSVLNEMGFETAETLALTYDLAELYRVHEQAYEVRDALDFDVDGVVYKVNDKGFQLLLGDNGREPLWAIAHKFPPKEELTSILSIDVQVGKSGKLTPMARIAPVTIGGTRITNVNLFNEDEVRRKDLHVGDSVYVARGGDVVPMITRKEVERGLTGLPDFTMPDKCPVCRSPVVKVEGEVAHRCTGGRACFAQWRGRLEHFVAKDAANIEGLGPVTCLHLAKQKKLYSFSDIYKLTEADLGSDKNALKILANIAASKHMPLNRFIYALGIPSVGVKAANALSKHFTDIDTLCNATKEELESIPELGSSVAANLAKYLSVKENVEEIRELVKAGIAFKPS